MLFINTDIGKSFNVKLIQSDTMNAALSKWDRISSGKPPWLDAEDGIETINMAKHISDTRAKLITLDIGITCSGSARADYLQGLLDDLLKRLPDKVADAVRLGGMMLKFNGQTWDFILPGDFGITKMDGNGDIVGAVFAQHISHHDAHYTRLEYHRFDGEKYIITNRAFRCQKFFNGDYRLGAPVPLAEIDEWAELPEEITLTKLEKPLFAYFRMPGANTIDPTSPLGLSAFANAIPELKAVDIAVSRKNREVEDSTHITFVGQALIKYSRENGIKLPRFVEGLGTGLNDNDTTAIHEHTPTLLTDERIKDINFNLSMAGVKCGFSEGVFVMDGQTGVVTATQIESDDRDTIQTIKTDRDALQDAIKQAIYGADALASLMNLSPLGKYELEFSFGDITYSYEEDKACWRSYVAQGWVPAWRYLVKFEKMSEEEAKALTEEAAPKDEPGLFGKEE